MLFYEINVTVLPKKTQSEEENSAQFHRGLDEIIGAEIIEYNEKNPRIARFFVCRRRESCMTLAAVITDISETSPTEMAKNVIKKMGYDIKKIDCEEITSDSFARLIHRSEKNGFIEDEDEVLQDVHLGSYRSCMIRKVKETLLECGKTEKKLRAEAAKLSCRTGLVRELDRIFTFEPGKFICHPVHYVFCIDDTQCVDNALKILASALHSVGRLQSRRIATIEAKIKENGPFFEPSPIPTLDMETVHRAYETISGGMVCLRPGTIEFESETAYSDMTSIEELAEEVFNHRKDCLTVLSFSKNERKALEKIKGVLNKMRFVEISEEAFSGKEAKSLLRKKAKEDGLNEVGSLLRTIENDVSYYMSDINRAYEEWVDKCMREVFFPQYRDIEYGVSTTPRVVGNAYDELQQMIGLGPVKKIIGQAIDFNRFQKRYQNEIRQQDKPSRHMVFTGNPGTAKTTVARLFAQIMRDNKVLSRGNLIEVGRQDLVGKYVGWTAHQVEEAFDRARGSVLFIDEAYSLCDDRSGMFGDEAINTIVQMMENRREETIVIFAGYPDKMRTFLDRNPGLRSRISFHVDFDDYSEDELVEILNLMVAKAQLNLGEDVEPKVRKIIGKAIGKRDFGNGRFVRNLLEKARMAQASRIMGEDEKEISIDSVNTLIADDFELLDDNSTDNTVRQIGFAG